MSADREIELGLGVSIALVVAGITYLWRMWHVPKAR